MFRLLSNNARSVQLSLDRNLTENERKSILIHKNTEYRRQETAKKFKREKVRIVGQEIAKIFMQEISKVVVEETVKKIIKKPGRRSRSRVMELSLQRARYLPTSFPGHRRMPI